MLILEEMSKYIFSVYKYIKGNILEKTRLVHYMK